MGDVDSRTRASAHILEDALTPAPGRDWTAFASSAWTEATLRYARRLADDRRLHVSWCITPPLAIVTKLG
jgi:hypothetical protein